MVFHPKIATSQNKDERLCKERGLEGVSSLIFDPVIYLVRVRMNADGLHLSRLPNGSIESLNHITKDLKKNEISFKKGLFFRIIAAVMNHKGYLFQFLI